MIFTAIRLLATGPLTAEQAQQLLDALDLESRARTEGPALDISIAHRAYTDETGRRLWVDLSRLSADGCRHRRHRHPRTPNPGSGRGSTRRWTTCGGTSRSAGRRRAR